MAGFFGMFNYEKAGPGVSKDAPKKKRFFLFFDIYLRKFWKILQVGSIYLIFCIPIITIGPATAGLCYVLRNFTREQHAFIFSDFFDAFKQNFKQAFIIGLLQTALLYLMYIAINFYSTMLNENMFYYVPFVAALAASIVLVFMSYYIYPMMVTMDLKLTHLIKNAFIFGVIGFWRNIFTSIFIAITVVFWLVVTLLFLPAFLLFLFFGIPFIAFMVTFNTYPLIKKHLIDPYYEANPDKRPPDYEPEDAVFSDEQLIPDRQEE